MKKFSISSNTAQHVMFSSNTFFNDNDEFRFSENVSHRVQETDKRYTFTHRKAVLRNDRRRLTLLNTGDCIKLPVLQLSLSFELAVQTAK